MSDPLARDLQAEYLALISRSRGRSAWERALLVYDQLCERHGPDSAEADFAWREVERQAEPLGASPG